MGDTVKSTPLFDVPMGEPPVDTVYHFIVLPADIAFRFEDAPQLMEGGVAVTCMGAAGGATFTVTAVRVSLTQPGAFHDMMICPFPVLISAVVLPEVTPPMYDDPPPPPAPSAAPEPPP
jgi:hypothetical protein